MKMEAMHNYKKSNEIDYITKIAEKNLNFSEGMYLAEIVKTKAKARPYEKEGLPTIVSIYLHKIRGLMIASTKLIPVEDTYAVVANHRSFLAYNVGAYLVDNCVILDKHHYDKLDSQEEKQCYINNICFSHIRLPKGSVIEVLDHHQKKKLDEIEVA